MKKDIDFVQLHANYTDILYLNRMKRSLLKRAKTDCLEKEISLRILIHSVEDSIRTLQLLNRKIVKL